MAEVQETPAVLRAKDPNTPPAELFAIAMGPDRNAALAAVDNPSTPEWARRQAAWRAYTFAGRHPEWRNIRGTGAGPVELATIPSRGFIYVLVDTTIAVILTLIVWAATVLLLGFGGRALGLPENAYVAIGTILTWPLVIGVYLGYFAVSYAKWGRTIGMRWISARVIDENTAENLTWGRAWLRSLVLNLAAFPFVGFLWWALTSNEMKQGPHDKAAKSLVVDAPKGQAVLKISQ